MKFSFMSFSCPELSLTDMLAQAKRLGYDGVEPRVDSGHAHGIELELDQAGRRAARELAGEVGVEYSCLATSCRYADPEIRGKMVDDTLAYLDLAADIGAPCMRVFGGTIPAGISREEAVEQVAGALSSVADHAAARGVVVCMETHDHWCNPEDVATVIKAVDSPAVQVNWDIMHPVRVAGVSMQEAFDVLKPWIRHCHVHDGKTVDGKVTLVPIGEGDIDHATAIRLLADMGWDGAMSGEWIGWEPWEEHLPREIAILKRLLAACS